MCSVNLFISGYDLNITKMRIDAIQKCTLLYQIIIDDLLVNLLKDVNFFYLFSHYACILMIFMHKSGILIFSVNFHYTLSLSMDFWVTFAPWDQVLY